MIRLVALMSMGAFVAMVVSLTPASSSGPDGPTVPFTTVAMGNTSRIREPAHLVIRDRDAWLPTWRRHAGPALQAPPVDFSHDIVIAMFAGQSAAPRRMAITRIIREPARLVVWYVLADTRPLPDTEGVNPVAPFHIVRLARSPLPVRFFQAKTAPVLPQP